MNPFWLVLKQTVMLAFRKGGGAMGCMAFYVISVTLFTFALGPEATGGSAGAVLCVALLLSTVTVLPLFYERDHEDGTLEQLLLYPMLLELLVLAKLLGQWLSCILPMLAVSPLLALSCGLSGGQMSQALWPLLLASPTVVALGSLAAALTLDTRRGGLLQALVVMPLYVPVLIFAASGQGAAALILSAMLFASLPLSCFLSAALIRISQE